MLSILHDHKNVVGRLYDFVQLSDGGVPDHFEDMQLASDSLYISDVLDFIFLKNFDRDGFLRGNMSCFFHFSEGAFSDG
jgi:hypothetical protein